MKKLDRSGFTAVETLLVLILVAMLGFTGFYVYNAQHNTTKTLDTAAKTAQNSTVSVSKNAASTSSSDTSVHTTVFSKLPSDLKAAVLADAKSEGCVNSQGQLIDDGNQSIEDTDTAHYVLNNAAFVGECHSQAFYAYTSGKWKFISKTQFGFNCSDLKQYSVSTQLFSAASPDNKCLDASNNFITYQ